MSFDVTGAFERAYRRKTPQQQARVDRALERLAANPHHPGLQVHRVRGTAGVWECYVNGGARITFEFGPAGVIVLRNNCGHDAALSTL